MMQLTAASLRRAPRLVGARLRHVDGRPFATSTRRGTSSSRFLSSARALAEDEDAWHQDEEQEPHRQRRQQQQHPRAALIGQASVSDGKIAETNLAQHEVHHSPPPHDYVKTRTIGVSPSSLTFTGDAVLPVTTHQHIVEPGEPLPSGPWPVYRLMDENGQFRDPARDGEEYRPTVSPSFADEAEEEHHRGDLESFARFLAAVHPAHAEEFARSALLRESRFPYPDTESRNTLLRAHRQMIRLRQMDSILQGAQRQGRISFYMTCTGEEAIHMGVGSALSNEDPILAQYREQGLLMWRGFTLEQFTNQCFSNVGDLGKGRQMPVHYGCKALNYHTVSSPLGTQIPQAVGAAYKLKLDKKQAVVACFFGDGCASTIDFHSGLNFAATLKVPVLFICRNNGYAISTPVTDQYAGDGIICRAPGYGMAAIRVDGNDVFAMAAATREAKLYAMEHSAPVLIEAMTYRQGHHSTSDDSTRYRSVDEVQDFANVHDPVLRFERFLKHHGWMTDEEALSMRDEEKIAVMTAMEQAEQKPKPDLEELFTDVYDEIPPHLLAQQKQLAEHLQKYGSRY